MISKKIINTDVFSDMPVSSQLLYFHLVMNADDEGFVGSPKSLMRMLGACTEDDLKILFAKRYVLGFETGIVVIKHWLIHNTIQKDRLVETTYKKEKDTLKLNEYSAYTECNQNVNKVLPKCTHRLDKIRLDKTSITSQKRGSVKFLKTDYDEIIKKYEELKCTTFVGSEYKPIQQTIKSMFMDKRNKQQILDLMTSLNNSQLEHWQSWNIGTVKKQIALFISGNLKF